MEFKYSFDRKFKTRINDDIWECYILTEEEAQDIDRKYNDTEDGFRAMTSLEDNCLFFVEGNITKSIIAHELFHVYVKYFYINSANVDMDQFEEIVAEFIEDRLEKFIRVRNRLYAQFLEYEEKVNENQIKKIK